VSTYDKAIAHRPNLRASPPRLEPQRYGKTFKPLRRTDGLVPNRGVKVLVDDPLYCRKRRVLGGLKIWNGFPLNQREDYRSTCSLCEGVGRSRRHTTDTLLPDFRLRMTIR
jgi:hypothetical protein